MRPDLRLSDLAATVGGTVIGSGDVVISDVTHDSRTAGPGSLFVAVRGFTSDGHDYAAGAIAGGAAAVCVDHRLDVVVPQLVVPDGRAVLALLAAAVHHHPSQDLDVVGVTGTNGKTTVVHLVESIATAAGTPCGLVGTIEARLAGRPVPIARTTPESTDLQRLLARMVDERIEVAALEVSSHALALHRVDHVRFKIAAFTNLTQDHLDFHKDMEAYFAAKASLFESERSGRAVIWVDDPYGERLAESVAIPVTRVGMAGGADVHAGEVSIDGAGSSFELRTPGEAIRIRLPLAGAFNVENALVAAACAFELGMNGEQISRGLATVTQIPGRFEKIESGQPFTVIVDYAHTPEGISAAIEAARRLTQGAVAVVVGAGGDRDRLKRPGMGAAAAAADLAIITSDNPRSEDPLAIITAVVEGMAATASKRKVEPDRRLAIRAALTAAGPGDVVLILGKGHEQGQEVKGRLEPFDDRRVAAEELSRLGVAP